VAYIKAGKAGLFPDAVKIFKYLTSKGIKFAVATFTTKAVVMEAFHQKPGVPQPQGFFDWNDSLRLKLEKPNPRIANIVLEQLDLRPEETAMVGDRLFTDVLAGNRLGLFTVLVKPVDPPGPTLPARPPATGGVAPGPLDQHPPGPMSMRRVVKVGTSLLRGSASRSTDAVIAALASSLSQQQRQGDAITLVTSGASGWAAAPWSWPRGLARWWLYRPPQPLARAG